MKFLVTAGFDRSRPALALCELLTRQGHQVCSVIVVSPWSFKRLRGLLASRGIAGLKNAVKKLLPGSSSVGSGSKVVSEYVIQHGIAHRSLKKWCADRGVNYGPVDNINSVIAVDLIKSQKIDALIYAGGGILRSSVIQAAGGSVINIHSGPLPEIRGMNAIEWSVLLDYEPAITLHFIDEGIDTGKIIKKIPLPLIKNESVESLRERAVVVGIDGLLQQLDGLQSADSIPTIENNTALAGRQCFIMAPAIRELLESKLAR